MLERIPQNGSDWTGEGAIFKSVKVSNFHKNFV